MKFSIRERENVEKRIILTIAFDVFDDLNCRGAHGTRPVICTQTMTA